jgi:hypothetical protein
MEEFLTKMMGKQLDVSCGMNSTVRGEIVAVEGGVLHLRDEDERIAYVAIEKVAVVWEVKDHEVRTGFVFGKKTENS